MMKILVIISLLILLTNPVVGNPSDVSPVTTSNMMSIASGTGAEDLYIEYKYWFQGGVSIELHIFGDGRAFYHKKVSSKEYQDAINEAHQQGIRITPYQWSLANCEYGDYEIYEHAELDEAQVQIIAQRIVNSSVLDFESELGDTTYHGLFIMLPGKITRKTAVIPYMNPFSEIAEFFKEEIHTVVDFQSCSSEMFETELINSISASNLPIKRAGVE